MNNQKTVLIVDDDPIVVQILNDMLCERLDSINILSATSYKKAVKHILDKRYSIDVAILDLNLPDANSGAAVSYAMKKNIPTIVLTASMNEKLKTILLENKILDYIIKGGKRGIAHAADSVVKLLKNQGKNILVVDDSTLQRKMAVDILKKMKLNVVTAANGLEAYGILKHSEMHFSLVLTDYNMPKMDGMELTLKIREDYGKDELGVIVFSGNKTPQLAYQFISIGANDFLNIPYYDVELITRINSNLELLDLFEKTKDMANKDFMTGAYNRRYFFEIGNTIFSKAHRDEKNLTLAMFDIDKFKNINDTYGHDVGDIAIKEVAQILNTHLRNEDLMARFGGEEFCVLLDNISLEDVEKLFEEIRLRFEKNVVKVGEFEISFTTSIGVCYGLADSVEEMIKKADKELYFCKENGRNQISINKEKEIS